MLVAVVDAWLRRASFGHIGETIFAIAFIMLVDT